MTSIRYIMIELQDAAGRLVVILPKQSRHSPKMYHVYIDDRSVAEFRTCREALVYVDSAVLKGQSESIEPTCGSEGLATAKYCRL
jgi:hypothetical protein